MRYARFSYKGQTAYGIIRDQKVFELDGCVFGDAKQTGREFALDDVRLLCPVENPSKVVAIGLNYLAHAKESGKTPPDEPLMFLKAPSAVIGPYDEIVLASHENRTDEEAELVVVIGKTCRSVSKERALDYVFGYTCGNDVSDRVRQRNDGQWTRAKSYDTYCPLGPWIETGIKDPGELRVMARLNGQICQDSSTRDLIFDVPTLIEAVSACMTLFPGDVIMTGTPEGVSALKPGDTVQVTIEGIGTLENKVR